MTDLERHAARLMELIARFEASDDELLRSEIVELLERVDHLHRLGVWRLFELVAELGGKELVDRITADPAVRMLFVLYDLIPTDPIRPIETGSGGPAPPGGGFVPIRQVLGHRPDPRVAFPRGELPPGVMKGVEIDRVPVLLCGLAGGVVAYRNACGRSILPLHVGSLVDQEIRCPWHGCRYDAATGRRLDGPGADLQAFEVTVRDDLVYVRTGPAWG